MTQVLAGLSALGAGHRACWCCRDRGGVGLLDAFLMPPAKGKQPDLLGTGASRRAKIEHMVDDASVRVTVTVAGMTGNDFQQAVRDTITQSIRDEYEPIFEQVRVNNQGQSVDVVKDALRHELAETDLTLTEDELTTYAKALAAGESININVNLDGL